ncbi:MAG: hypothetical protein QNL05_02185 [Gammaproteobacteria bacterium]|nr:hypothetical protein [Gammaproteobacteria bacterium]MDX2486338.1 hypothetical protein [Gammaproteobacteria bacterium]
MSQKKKPVKGENLSDAIRSLQSLLDDVSTDQRTLLGTTVSAAESSIENKFEETLEFDSESTGAAILVSSEEASAVDIDSHFDMNIPPALPDEADDDEMDYVIPTLSETIVAGDIPVLKEIVQLPDGTTIPEPAEISLDDALQSDNLPTPVSDAAEAAADAVQIILARYRSKPLTPEVRERIIATVTKILINSPELEIPDTIL